MIKMIFEIRAFLAVQFLRLAFTVMPNSMLKVKLSLFLTGDQDKYKDWMKDEQIKTTQT